MWQSKNPQRIHQQQITMSYGDSKHYMGAGFSHFMSQWPIDLDNSSK